MDPETNQLEEIPHLAILRSQFRSAILSRRKSEARGILGKLVALSGEEDDRRNLDELIRGVELELQRYTGELGSIQKRLQDGALLDTIQQELNSRTPHWRAFANDIPELKLARDGLPAHEDPDLKRKLEELEIKLAGGAVQEVLDTWIELGQPEAAAKGVFVQALNAFADLGASLEKRDWKGAKECIALIRQLLETEDGLLFQRDCLPQVDSMEDRLRWELLLIKCATSSELTGRERNRLLVELTRAENDIDFRIRDNPALDEIHGRIKDAIEAMNTSRPAVTEERGNAKPLIVVVLLLFALVFIVIWVFFRSTDSSDPTGRLKSPHDGPALSLHANPAATSLLNTR